MRNIIFHGTILSLATVHATHAQDVNVSSVGVEDIVVTATRRAENIQQVPLAITAVSDVKIEQANATNLENIARIAPGLQIQRQFVPGNAVFQIRGQFLGDTTPTVDAPVSIYFDDVYVARSPGSLTNLVDIERVEVLKGPQGTLFGKNTTGGAVRIISKQPTDNLEGYVKLGYQSFDRFTVEGVVNVPIVQDVGMRFVGQFDNQKSGYGINKVTGDDIDHNRTYFARGTLKIDAIDNLHILIQGDYTRIRAGGLPAALTAFSPENGANSAVAAAVQAGIYLPSETSDPAVRAAAIAAGTLLLQNEAALNNMNRRHVGADVRSNTATSGSYDPLTRTVSFNGGATNPFNNYQVYGGQGTIIYDVGSATFKSITGYRKVRYDSAYEVDGSLYFLSESRGRLNQKQFSEELILQGQAFDDKLDWTIGGLYFKESALQSDRSLPLAYSQIPFGVAGTLVFADTKSTSWAGFAQGTFRLTDAISLTVGGRYSHDKREFQASSFNVQAGGNQVCTYSAANGLSLLPIFSQPCTLRQSASFNQFSYTGSLQYEFGQNQTVYVRTSRGYRGGGFNARINHPLALGAFKPEFVTDYELGVKADWFDRRVRTNIALYTSKTTDTQLSFNSQAQNPVGQPVSVVRTVNIGSRKVHGVELEATVRPTDFLTIDGNLVYTAGKQVNPQTLDVDFLPTTPKWAYTIGGTLDHALGDEFMTTLRVDLSYRGKMQDSNVLRNPATGAVVLIPTYRARTLLGARLSVRKLNSGIEVSLFGTNLLDTEYEARTTGLNGLGVIVANLAEPRVIGAQLKIPFGTR